MTARDPHRCLPMLRTSLPACPAHPFPACRPRSSKRRDFRPRDSNRSAGRGQPRRREAPARSIDHPTGSSQACQRSRAASRGLARHGGSHHDFRTAPPTPDQHRGVRQLLLDLATQAATGLGFEPTVPSPAYSKTFGHDAQLTVYDPCGRSPTSGSLGSNASRAATGRRLARSMQVLRR
jgi:hypothetical protein